MIGMVGVIEDVSQITTQAFKQVDDLIYLIGEPTQILTAQKFKNATGSN